jgi:hypothetical protein
VVWVHLELAAAAPAHLPPQPPLPQPQQQQPPPCRVQHGVASLRQRPTPKSRISNLNNQNTVHNIQTAIEKFQKN